MRCGGDALTFVSAHVAPDQHHKQNLRALVDALTPALSGRRFVLGGDFNAARHWGEVYPSSDQSWFFAELARRGVEDCHWSLHGREVQTFFGRQTVERYQTDHLFADAASLRAVAECVVQDYAAVRGLSDHAPVVLRFDAAGDGAPQL